MKKHEIIGPATDHYDASEIFDDEELGHPLVLGSDAQKHALRAVVKQAQRSRLPPPVMTVSPAEGELGDACDIDDVLDEVLGVDGDEAPGKPFTPAVSAQFPVTQNLYRKFRGAMPSPKIVRVDTDESYAKWCDEKRAPFLAELEQHVDALERAIESGSGDIEVLGAEADAARERAEICGERVPLSLHPATADAVKCWKDGNQIFCSVRMAGPDGHARIATTATPLEKHTDEVLGYAADVGVDEVAAMDVLSPLAHVLGGGMLVTQLTKAAPELLKQPAVVAGQVFIGRIEPKCDPAVASVMSLLQLCQTGNKQACWEAEDLGKTEHGQKLLESARRGLAQAKAARKAKGGR
jgi:hypothetical protein